MYAINLTDGYKVDHRRQMPKEAYYQLNNFTFRKSRNKAIKKVVYIGMQYIIKRYLKKEFEESFFNVSEEAAVGRFQRRIDNYLPPGHGVTFDHIRAFHKLGYLPIIIKSIPEGARINIGVPPFTVEPSKVGQDHVWLIGYLETLISCLIWGPCTSATTAYEYKKLLNSWAMKTVGNTDFVKFQGHDFSMRGMFGLEAAMMSGFGHLTSFVGTDTIPAIDFAEDWYGADCTKELIGCSVAATEHSVMCTATGFYIWDKYAGDWSKIGEAEEAVFKRLITEVYPTGIISVVSDTWDLYRVLCTYMVNLKDVILARDGKIVIRPDSGDPADIICGTSYEEHKSIEDAEDYYNDIARDEAYEAIQDGACGVGDIVYLCKVGDQFYNAVCEVETIKERGGYSDANYYTVDGVKVTMNSVERTPAQRGVIELLYETFGGTMSEKGYILLDSHVGAIYGDSITLERANDICQRLADKGFASINIVFGIGSFTYQYVTRDTFGGAIKATFAKARGTGGADFDIEIFKDPITDDGTKKSARGRIKVEEIGTVEPISNKFIHKGYKLVDRVTEAEFNKGALEEVFRDGKIIREFSLSAIRARLEKSLVEEDD